MKRFCARRLKHSQRARGVYFLSLALYVLFVSCVSRAQSSPAPSAVALPERGQNALAAAAYDLTFALDFDARTFKGSERLHWINEDNQATSVLYFHLYANLRGNETARSETPLDEKKKDNSVEVRTAVAALDEPRLDILEVRDAATNAVLDFELDDRATTLRINLREQIASGAAADISIEFEGSVPEIDAEETGLLAHVFGQVDAALRRTRETRRARDINFRSRGVMLLGSAYPVLAARIGGEWRRKAEQTIGDTINTDVADYRVRVDAPANVFVYASGNAPLSETSASAASSSTHEFAGENLRNFAFIAGRGLRVMERQSGDVKVRSIYMAEHEAAARRVLAAAADAVRVYTARFGATPYKTISVVDVPLVAGLGCAEFAGLGAIASAFYVDFDAPAMRSLPELIREQRASVEDSLEWTVAHVVAHQWWGAAVGNDPERAPVLDEALANYSALAYYQDVHGEARAGAALDDQLRGVYRVYRTFGGEDLTVTRAAREYRNFFQYAAIVTAKGALMFAALRRLMGDEKFFAALRRYYAENRFEIAELDDLRGAFFDETPPARKRLVARTFNRWLSEKHGDEDIAPPDPRLASSLGLNPETITTAKSGEQRNAFARVGRFFWQQMTRIR
ncbi:MAG: M1 family aminopeptidase [Pyrinomonadaceae bacterium]